MRASSHLVDALRVGEPLASAVNNEKVRSELLVAPVLLELKRQHPGAIGLLGRLIDKPPRLPPALVGRDGALRELRGRTSHRPSTVHAA